MWPLAAMLAACAAKSADDRAQAAAADIESLAAEAQMLRREDAQGAIPAPFLAVHRRMLAERLEQSADELRQAREQGANGRAGVLEQARQLDDELRR
jgi:hypothetical protein